MSNYKTDVVYKITKEKKGKGLECGNLYFKNVPVAYAQVHKAGKMFESEDTAYTTTIFIDQSTMDKVEELGINKEFAEVGKTKLKKGPNRGKLKFPVEGEYENYGGMFATQVTRKTVKRDKEGTLVKTYEPLKVIDATGTTFTEDVGNGSLCTVKLFCYRNSDDMLVMMMDTVMVVEHIPYEGSGGDGYDDEMGVKIPPSKPVTSAPTEASSASTQESTPAPSTPAPSVTTSGVDAFDDDAPF